MADRLQDAGPASQPSAGSGEDDPDDLPAGPEVSLHLPQWLVDGIDRRRAVWTPVDTVAAWLTVAHLLLLTLLVGRGSFFLDDLTAQAAALDRPFWSFVLGSGGPGGFAPVPHLLDWVQSHLLPLEHTPAVVVTLVVRLLLAVGFWRLLRRVLGPHPFVLVPFALLLFTPALLPATTWYRGCVTVLAGTVATVWAVDATVRWVLGRHPADLVAVAGWTVAGVCCDVKGAAIPVVVTAVALALFFRSDVAATGPDRPVRSALVAAGVSAVVVLLYLTIYLPGAGRRLPVGVSAADMVHLARDAGTHAIVPMLLGGPWSWSYPSPYAGVARVGTTALMFCVVLAGLLVGVALRRDAERTVRALLVLMVWGPVSLGVVALGRYDAVDLLPAGAQRLWADGVPAVLLAGALALLPWAVGAGRPGGPRDEVSAAGAGSATSPMIGEGDQQLTVPAIAAGLAALLVLGGSAYSSYAYAQRWWDNPTGTWIGNARASLVNAEPYPRVLATPLPVDVVPAGVAAELPTSAPLLLLLRPDIRFHDGDGDAKVMNAVGMRAPYLPGVVASTAQAKLCLPLPPVSGDEPASVALGKFAPYVPGAQVEVGLLLQTPTKVQVTVVTPGGKVFTPQRFSDDELPPGPHAVRVPVPLGQAVASVRVRLDGAQQPCVPYARVWAPLS